MRYPAQAGPQFPRELWVTLNLGSPPPSLKYCPHSSAHQVSVVLGRQPKATSSWIPSLEQVIHVALTAGTQDLLAFPWES